MSKLFKVSDETQNLVDSVLNTKSNLLTYGLQIDVIGVKKSNELIKVAKGTEVIEHYADKTDIVIIYIYEAAFDLLDEQTKRINIENAIEGIVFDSEKDKITIVKTNINMYSSIYKTHKFAAVEALEMASLVIGQIEQEEKDNKEAKKIEREAKKSSKAEQKMQKKNNYMSVIE
jgi:hypothetical protein